MTDPDCGNPVLSDIIDFTTSDTTNDHRMEVERDNSNHYDYRGAF